MAADWFAVYTKHQHEKSAASLFEKKGIEHFLPLYRAVHRWKDRKQRVSLPLFPCYVFVKTELERKVEVLQTGGVRWFVENAGRACPVPEAEVQALQKICASGLRVEPHPFLQEGDIVNVVRGPLAGVTGILAQMKSGHRIILSVELLKRSLAVEVDVAAVERFGPARTSMFV